MNTTVRHLVILIQFLSFHATASAEDKADASRYITGISDEIILEKALNNVNEGPIAIDRLLALLPPRFDECKITIRTKDYRPPISRPGSQQKSEQTGSIWSLAVKKRNGVFTSKLEDSNTGGSDPIRTIDLTMSISYFYSPKDGKWPVNFETDRLPPGIESVVYHLDEEAMSRETKEPLNLHRLFEIAPPPRSPIRMTGRDKSVGPFSRASGAWAKTAIKKEGKWRLVDPRHFDHRSALVPRYRIAYIFSTDEARGND